ncbi:hypothetical protein TELCIR_16723 [Teladorsagia circumcincta]|uniref:Uncharacterized protein n=1 Tax=Teladorsagia circumcincta TaxID=45464 RepID=A0A2G9TUU1_TELCI|nr:hypothetical protein TELCIR_16723 [Teladorsagia circumcincta]
MMPTPPLPAQPHFAYPHYPYYGAIQPNVSLPYTYSMPSTTTTVQNPPYPAGGHPGNPHPSWRPY